MGLNLNNLRSCKVTRITDQSIPDATATALSFSTPKQNPNGLWVSTAATKITVDKAGLYWVNAGCVFAAGATGVRTISIQVNGVASTFPLQANQAAPAAGTGKLNICGLIYLANADYIEVVVTQNNGGALNVTADTTAFSPFVSLVLAVPDFDPSANSENV